MVGVAILNAISLAVFFYAAREVGGSVVLGILLVGIGTLWFTACADAWGKRYAAMKLDRLERRMNEYVEQTEERLRQADDRDTFDLFRPPNHHNKEEG